MKSSGYVLDTHALVFYAGGEFKKLGRRAREVFAAYERGEIYLVVPMPVVIELWLLHMGGQIDIPTSFETWWSEVSDSDLVVEELTDRDVCAAASLVWRHHDPFDRLIVAIAQRLQLPLLTRDSAIEDWALASGRISVAW
jgi:PIN domain nuclease of toxin-antitoxin system